LWGCDPYADKSDIVAVLMHSGYFIPHFPYPSEIHGLLVTLHIMAPLDKYPSTTNYYIKSQDGSYLKNVFFFYLIKIFRTENFPSQLLKLNKYSQHQYPL
jgi:hypothetical protein